MSNLSMMEMRRNPFWLRRTACQWEILQRGRPRPPLPTFRLLVDLGDKQVSMRPFHPSQYDRTPWLTACDNPERLFCWPCLLLAGDTLWNTQGFSSPFYLPRLGEHERKLHHVRSSLQLKLLMDRLKVPHQSVYDLMHGAVVRRNREVLKRVVDAVNFVVLQRRLSKKASVDPMTVEECVAAVDFLSLHGCRKDDPAVAEDAGALLRSDPEFLIFVVGAVGNVLKYEIKKEVRRAEFVSVVLTGHRRSQSSILRSTLLRFAKDGRVRERCVGFHHEAVSRESGEKFLGAFFNTVANYQLDQKLSAVAVDGLCPFSIENVFNNGIYPRRPSASLVPCYFHQYLHVVVQKLSCSSISNDFEGLFFFKTMESMVSFLRRHSDDVYDYLSANIRSYADLTLLKTDDIEMDSSGSFVVLSWINSNRRELIDYFDHASTSDRWVEDDLACLRWFRKFLSSFNTVFWLTAYDRLFSILKDVQEILDSPHPDTLLSSGMLQTILSRVDTERSNGFSMFWSILSESYNKEIQEGGMSRRDRVTPRDRPTYSFKYNKIVWFLRKLTSDRFGRLQKPNFFKLLDPSNFHLIFTDKNLLRFFLEKYDSLFDWTNLRREIEDLFKSNQALLEFTIEELLEYMTRLESRRKSFPNTIRLAELVLSMPCIKPPDVRPPVIQKVKAIVPSLNLPQSPDFSVLYVENELLEEIRLGETFYNEVIDVFNQITKDDGMLLF